MAERATDARSATRRLRDAAFVRLADEHLDRAYRLARAILRDPAEAQDATHDAFVQAWRKWETLRDPSRFEPWFDRILVNTCRNRLRSTRRLATDISAEVASRPVITPAARGPRRHRRRDRGAVARPPGRRRAALLPRPDGRRHRHSARRPAGTVQSRLHYALKRLHDAIDAADTRGPSDDRSRARRAAAGLVRGRGRRDRDGARGPAREPRHDPGDDAGAAAPAAAGAEASRCWRSLRSWSSAARWPRAPGSCDPRPVVTPAPNVAVVVPTRHLRHPQTPAPTPNIRPGRSIAFIRLVDKGRTCYSAHGRARAPVCGSSEPMGTARHEVISDGVANQAQPVWSPDGTRLLYFDEGKLYLTDPSGSRPTAAWTPAAPRPCQDDSRSHSPATAEHRLRPGFRRCVRVLSVPRRSPRWTSRAAGR